MQNHRETQAKTSKRLPKIARTGAKPFRPATAKFMGTVLRMIDSKGALLIKMACKFEDQHSDGTKVLRPAYIKVVAVGRARDAILALGVKENSTVLNISGGMESDNEGVAIRVATAEKITSTKERRLKFEKDAKGNKVLLNGVNEVTMLGNLVENPVQRETRQSEPVANFTIALSDRYFKGPDLMERTAYVDVSAFREAAVESGSLQKGNGAHVKGHLLNKQFERGGQQVYQTYVEASAVQPQVKHQSAQN